MDQVNYQTINIISKADSNVILEPANLYWSHSLVDEPIPSYSPVFISILT